MEGKCLAQAAALNETIYRKYNIPRGKAGAIVCAFTDAEVRNKRGWGGGDKEMVKRTTPELTKSSIFW